MVSLDGYSIDRIITLLWVHWTYLWAVIYHVHTYRHQNK